MTKHRRLVGAVARIAVSGLILTLVARTDFTGRAEGSSPTGSAGDSKPATTRTFLLHHTLASEMAEDLRQILLGRPGMEAKPSADNLELTVAAPGDVLRRVATFVEVQDWPDRVDRGPEYF